MAIDFNKPVESDSYSTLLAALREHHQGQAKLWEGVTLAAGNNPPAGAVRINSGLFQSWSGSAWAEKTMGYAKKSNASISILDVQRVLTTTSADDGDGIPLVVSGGNVNTFAGMLWSHANGGAYLGIDSASRLRFGTSPSVSSNEIVWHSGNDGSSSGLDADLLDGEQGSYYRSLANATGTLAAARVSGSIDYSMGGGSLVGGYRIGWQGTPPINITSALSLNRAEHAGMLLRHLESTARVLTLQTEAAGGWDGMSFFEIYNYNGAGALTLRPASGVTLYIAGGTTNGDKSIAQRGYARVKRIDPDFWLVLDGVNVS